MLYFDCMKPHKQSDRHFSSQKMFTINDIHLNNDYICRLSFQTNEQYRMNYIINYKNQK